MTFRIGQEVKIKGLVDYSYDPELPSLKPGSKGRIVGEFQHPYRHDDHWWIVRLNDGEFPFYSNELERV